MKKMTTHICVLSSALLFTFSSTSTMAREYYKWVDAKGSTHYTTTPPPKSAKKQGRVETFGTKTATVATTPATQAESAPATTNSKEQTSPNTPAEVPASPETAQPLK